MAETKTRRARRRRLDNGIRIQKYLTSSSSPEEMLFKINEMIYSQAGSSSRRNLRVPVSIPVSYRIGGDDFTGDTYTLSQDGLFIKTPEPLEKNTSISLKLNLPGDSKEIKAEGEVIDCMSPDDAVSGGALSGMAVVFHKIKQEDRKRIRRYVKARAKDLFKAG